MKQYDITSLVHCEIQNCAFSNKITMEKVIEALKSFADSVENCNQLSIALKVEHQLIRTKLEKNEPVAKELACVKEYTSDLEKEDAVKYHLIHLKKYYCDLFQPHCQYIDCNPSFHSAKEIDKAKQDFEIKFYSYLNTQTYAILGYLDNCLKIAENRKEEDLPIQEKQTFQDSTDIYSFEGNLLRIVDFELKIDITNHCEVKKEELFYLDGKIKAVIFRHKGKLHGPSTFYSKEGVMLSQVWFVEGSREGKGKYYYLDGKPYAIDRYKDNKQEMKHEYFYTSGLVKSIIPYSKGKLHGDVLLYYPNGRLFREIHFLKGKKNGVEKMWNNLAILILEGNYKNDKACGTARAWDDNGLIIKEIFH